jgi:hypothetical protein
MPKKLILFILIINILSCYWPKDTYPDYITAGNGEEPDSANPPISSTIPPISSTIPPISSTIPPISSTIPPISSTIPPISSTIPPISSTIPPIINNGETIIIDHTCTDLSQIPLEYIEAVKHYTANNKGLLLWYTGESHSYQIKGGMPGENIRGGMELLEAQNPLYAVEIQSDPADFTENYALRLLRGRFSINRWTPYNMGEEEYWSHPAARLTPPAAAISAGEAGTPIHIAMWTWCWDIAWDRMIINNGIEISPFTETETGIYLDALTSYNSDPGIDTVWVYQTAVTDTIGDDRGLRTFRMNNLIREFVNTHGGILFDWADIETWSADGSRQNLVTWEGQQFELRHPDWEGEQIGHGNTALSIQKARALWWLLARAAGWPGI